MKIPDKVKVGGITYEVKKGVERLSLGDRYGAEIIYCKAVIEIGNQNSRQVDERNFLHELVHAMNWELGYADQNEKNIDEFAGVLYQVIVDNPDMFKE